MKLYEKRGEEFLPVKCTGCGSEDDFSIAPDKVSCKCGVVLR
jgi:ribosomal protein S27E